MTKDELTKVANEISDALFFTAEDFSRPTQTVLGDGNRKLEYTGINDTKYDLEITIKPKSKDE